MQTGCGGEEMQGEHSHHHPRVLQRASYVLQLAHLSPLAWLPRRVRMCVEEGKGEGEERGDKAKVKATRHTNASREGEEGTAKFLKS